MAATLFRADIDKTQSRDLTTDLDLSREELLALLELAEKVKHMPVRYAKALTGRYLSLVSRSSSRSNNWAAIPSPLSGLSAIGSR
jgi:hypothetical protein